MITAAFWTLTVIAFAAGLRWGGRPDRMAVSVLIVGIVLTRLVEGWFVGGVRWGVALVDVLTLCGVVAIALQRRRWWLILLSSAQLLVVSTHVLTIIRPDFSSWAASTVRLVIWGFILLTIALGTCEAVLVRKYRLEDIWRNR